MSAPTPTLAFRLAARPFGPLLLTAAFFLCAPAHAVPSTDPAEKPLALTAPADTAGKWTADATGLSLASPDPVMRYDYWLAKEPAFTSGMLRARVKIGAKLDSTVLFRASVPAGKPENLSGYGFSFEGDEVGFYRWTDGVVVPLAAMVKVEGLDERAEVEVVLYLVGPHMAAIVFDGSTLQQIASVTAHDATFPTGRVGFRAHGSQGPDTKLVHLAILNTQVGARSPALDADAFGPTRFATIDAADVAKLPVGVELVDDDGTVARVVGSAEQIELLRRKGVRVRKESGHLPRVATDAAYRANRATPFRETPTGFDLSVSYKDNEMVEATLRAFHEAWPDVTALKQIGTTGQGRPIWALRVTDNPYRDEDEPAVLLDGMHHGTELLSTEYALDALEYTLAHREDPQVKRWITELDLWFVPMVNPDGNACYWHISGDCGRKAVRDADHDGRIEAWEGVDLNRNYPFAWGSLAENGSRSWENSAYYRGPAGGSEPETQVMMDLAKRYRFAAAISWHTWSTVIITPYSIDGQDNPEPDVPRAIAESIAATMPTQPNGKKYKVVRKIYAVDGTDQDWHYHAHGTLAYIVEGSHHNPTDPTKRARSISGVRPFYTGLLDRLVTGPRIAGHVVDDGGNPVEAVVTIDQIVTHEGEEWTSRPSDGRFDRVVLAPGRYTVRAVAPGHGEAVATVTVADGPVSVDLVVPRLLAGD